MLCGLRSDSSLLRGCSEEWLITSKCFDPDSDRRGSRLLFAASVLLDLHNCLQPTPASAPEVLLNTSLRVQNPFPWYLLVFLEHSIRFFWIKAAVCVLKILELSLSQRFSDFPTEFCIPQIFRVRALGLSCYVVVWLACSLLYHPYSSCLKLDVSLLLS